MAYRPSHGKPVVDGVVNYLSPSAIATADPSEYAGCLRRWWYKYIGGMKEDSSPSQVIGTKIHSEIENYVVTGQKNLSSKALPAIQHLQEDLTTYEVERGIEFEQDDIKIIGYIDLLSHQPPEIIDWKTTSDMSRALTGRQVADSLQMTVYAQWYFKNYPVDNVRVSFVYLGTKAAFAIKRGLPVEREEVDKRWKKRLPIIEDIKLAAKCTNPDQVPANTKSCECWRGCVAIKVCSAYGKRSISELLGGTASTALKERTMSLLEKVKTPQEMIAEIRARGTAPAVKDGLKELVETIEGFGMGFPAINGDLAKEYAAFRGYTPAKAGYSGTGKIGGVTVDSFEKLQAMLVELKEAMPLIKGPSEPVKEETVSFASTLPQLLPPDAPSSNPELAADPIEDGVTLPKKGRGRPRKTDAPPINQRVIYESLEATAESSIESVPDIVYTAEAPTVNNPATRHTVVETKINLYVDCISSVPTQQLAPYIDVLCQSLCKSFNAADIRCAPIDSPLGFGKWKGALAALVRDTPPTPGSYFLLAKGNEIAEVVADALRPLCNIYVKGL